MSLSDVVIRAEGLGKSYSLHHKQSERYTALRDVLARQVKAASDSLLNPSMLARQLRLPHRKTIKDRQECFEEFWALKDVSFEIRQGDRVGIIGRNGAGKSTLLKILSRITEPTTGRVEIRGRLASLLEVGTGFHPELTGRENIYLNGAILGMTRREIRSKFDEIVDFAEVEKFLDTPVKRYSSGMYVRLAFAVAAHLEPEILVVDEVLAVGDASFQKKCLGKMKDVSRQGRTILFVSHNIGVLQSICDRGLFLEAGLLASDKYVDEAIKDYITPSSTSDVSCLSWGNNDAPGNKSLAILAGVAIRDDREKLRSSFLQSEQINIDLVTKVFNPKLLSTMRLSLEVVNEMGLTLFTSSDQFARQESASSAIDSPMTVVSRCKMPSDIFKSGSYTIKISGGIPGQINLFDLQRLPIAFVVESEQSRGSYFDEQWPGVFEPKLFWQIAVSPFSEHQK